MWSYFTSGVLMNEELLLVVSFSIKNCNIFLECTKMGFLFLHFALY